MSTEVLYRKWRPRAFAEVAGQEPVVRTLTNAIASGKVAHAYLLCGPRGTGKTTTGRLLAKAVNCLDPKDGEPCNACERCLAFLEGRALDLIELDAASNRGIDEIRSLREKANFAPAGGRDARKVYLVDEVHMLTEPAFNALLKTLEEPPAHVIFVLATTEAHKVPATVVSRCQRFDFRRVPLAALVDRLAYIAEQEGIECPRDALELIGRAGTGSLRDAINLLDQLADSYGKSITVEQVREGLGLVEDPRSVELCRHALHGDLAQGLAVISSVRDDGLDLRQFQRQVVARLRGLLLAKAGAAGGESWTDEQLADMRALVADVPPARIVAALHAFGEADLRADPLSPLPLELALATTVVAPEAPPAPAATKAPTAAQPAAQPRPAPPAPRPAKREEAVPPTFARPQPDEPAAVVPPSAPPPAPSPASTDSNGSLLTEVRSRWQEIYQRARDLQYRAGALLNSGCGIIEATGDEVVFGFKHQMLLDRMHGDGGENLRALQQAVDEVLGPGRTVRCVKDETVEQQRLSRGGHLVRAAEELGGRALPNES
jgi:DNA polymerase-3 subunit gamma/tau